jgi:alkylation response protein AidB-like acyl-CoA dehydrogenase
MAKYKADFHDIFFNLFEDNKIHKLSDAYGESDLKDIVRQFDKFVENEVYPTRQKSDHDGVKLANKQVVVPSYMKEATKKFYDNGWFGLGYSEEIGGMPGPEALNLVCTSLFTGANVALSMYYGLSRAAMNVVLKVGSKEQKDLIIPPMMTGSWGGTMCLTEPGAGSDVGNAKTTAEPVGNGQYKIRGVKIFISSGDNDIYENIIHLVLARTPKAPEGTKGLSLFIVPKYKIEKDGSRGASNGVFCTKIEEKMGLHGSSTCELTFGADGECLGTLIGKEFDGMTNMFIMMNEARLLCGMQGESQANLAFELTKQYAKERVQFGSPLIELPDVKRMLLKMRALSRGMRALNVYTANLFDRVKHGEQEMENRIALLTPICKSWCSDNGFKVSVDAIQVHGGYGYCTEYGIEQFARDIKIATIYEGTNGIQAIDFVMRKVLKDRGETLTNLAKQVGMELTSMDKNLFGPHLQLMSQVLGDLQRISVNFSGWVQDKKMNIILQHATDFLTFSGNFVVSWLLLRQANLAKDKLSSSTGEEREYYQSKVDDFKFFASHILVENLSIAHCILNQPEDITGLVI